MYFDKQLKNKMQSFYDVEQYYCSNKNGKGGAKGIMTLINPQDVI